MAGEVYKTEAEYEAMTVEELSDYKDLDLRLILQRVFGLDSVVYFIDKAQKMTYVSQPDQRPSILAVGEEKRGVHRETNKENRHKPKGSVEERMEAETKDRSYHLVNIERAQGAKDDFTGRSHRIVYVISDQADGSQFRVSRGTCRWLEDRGKLEGFVVSSGRQSFAHTAGMKSAADLLTGAPEKKTKPTVDQVKEEEDERTIIEDDELEDILNSLPS